MAVITRYFQIKSSGENDTIDITERTSEVIKDVKLENGIVTVFVVGSIGQ